LTILKILRYPDPRLRTVARPVQVVNGRIHRLIDDMLETMYAAGGLGLSATQIDVHERVVVIDLSPNRDQPLVLVNPELVMCSAEFVASTEGCLSVPGAQEKVSRHAFAKVHALDRDAHAVEFEARGLLASCIQHELDHLAGIVFVDKLGPLRRSRILEKLSRRPSKFTAAWHQAS
jgi:peptide deformylase